MVTIDALRAALERIAKQAESDADLQLLQQALARGEITVATGERAVAIGGDARDLAIITGNGNVVNVFKGMDARALMEVLAFNGYREDYTLLLLFCIFAALLWALWVIFPHLLPGKQGGLAPVALSVLVFGSFAALVILVRFLRRWQRLKPTVMAAWSLLMRIVARVRLLVRREKSTPNPESTKPISQPAAFPHHLAITPEQSQTAGVGEGIYGGLIGGALAGLVNSLSYHLLGLSSYFAPGSAEGRIALPSIFVYSCIAGIALGFATQVSILIVRRLYHSSLSYVLGSILGGAVAGIGIGALGGWIFGNWPPPFVDIPLFQGSLALGVMCIAVAIRWHVCRRAWMKASGIFVVAFFVTAVLFLLATKALPEAIASFWDHFFYISSESTLLNIEGGMILGVVIGATVGFIVGLTAAVYDWWQRPKLFVRS